VRGKLNLEAEALAQLKAVFSADIADAYLPAGRATEQARLDYAAERLRLFYVGITRAKRELIVTWNTGRSPGQALQEATPLIASRTWWEEHVKPGAFHDATDTR
jgi:DNA helicase-2/ATP-dependent DNA helicase PcrA